MMAGQITCGWLVDPSEGQPWKWVIPRSTLLETTVYLRVHLPGENIVIFVCLYFKKYKLLKSII